MIITDKRREALRKKQANPPTTDHQHWYQMWGSLFENQPEPPSPYKEADPVLLDFREYAEQQALSVVQRYRTSHPNVTVSNALLTEFFHFMLSHVIDDYTSQLTSQGADPAPIPALAFANAAGIPSMDVFEPNFDFLRLVNFNQHDHESSSLPYNAVSPSLLNNSWSHPQAGGAS